VPESASEVRPLSRSARSAKADCNRFFVALEGQACTIVGVTFGGGPLNAVKDITVNDFGTNN